MAVTADEVKKLAALSRLNLTDEEVEKLRGEIDSIVAYIDTVQQVPLPAGIAASPHLDLVNVMRPDTNPHEPGAFTKDIVGQFPNEENGFLKVKKILG
jgi:aspartyl-tRNA(Asn)/glutamyl-tRNA(Gln) amidotransferase subunit C